MSLRGRPPTPGLREAILAAGERVFGRRDYSQVQMDDVAAACGVGKGTLYRYFPEQAGAVPRGHVRRHREAPRRAGRRRRETDSAARALEQIVRRTLAFFWDRRGFFALIHRHELEPDADVREWFAQRAELTRIVEDTVRRAIAAGDLRPIDPRLATEMLFGHAPRREPLPRTHRRVRDARAHGDGDVPPRRRDAGGTAAAGGGAAAEARMIRLAALVVSSCGDGRADALPKKSLDECIELALAQQPRSRPPARPSTPRASASGRAPPRICRR
jgi:AcrR family transcriptional regulator